MYTYNVYIRICQIDIFNIVLYKFSVTAAVTNYHKLSNLKQHKFIIVQFYSSEVQNGSRWIKINKLGKVVFQTLGENLFPCFQFLEVFHIPWLKTPFLHISGQ